MARHGRSVVAIAPAPGGNVSPGLLRALAREAAWRPELAATHGWMRSAELSRLFGVLAVALAAQQARGQAC